MDSNERLVEKTLHIGVDLVHVPRIQRLLEHAETIARFLGPTELTQGDAAHMAGRIAAKEALFKALGIAPPRWQEVEVQTSERGQPLFIFSPELEAKITSYHLSIAHDGEYAVACVVVVVRGP
jgi:phosphopantetheine--protein transferase-like protein